jgi:CTP synthase
MQCAVIEYGRNVLGYTDANSTEMNAETSHPVIALMEEQKAIENKGGTMRLGAYPCKLTEGSLASTVYDRKDITERHRHRYEFNNSYLEAYQKAGMKASGINPKGKLVEIVELKEHPWFIGVQFHPEYRSTVARPHPLFVGFVQAAVKQGVTEVVKAEA